MSENKGVSQLGGLQRESGLGISNPRLGNYCVCGQFVEQGIRYCTCGRQYLWGIKYNDGQKNN